MHADVLCLCVSPRFPSFVALLRLVLSYDDIECLYLLPDLNVGCRVGGKHMSCAHLLLGPLPRSASPPGLSFSSQHTCISLLRFMALFELYVLVAKHGPRHARFESAVQSLCGGACAWVLPLFLSLSSTQEPPNPFSPESFGVRVPSSCTAFRLLCTCPMCVCCHLFPPKPTALFRVVLNIVPDGRRRVGSLGRTLSVRRDRRIPR